MKSLMVIIYSNLRVSACISGYSNSFYLLRGVPAAAGHPSRSPPKPLFTTIPFAFARLRRMKFLIVIIYSNLRVSACIRGLLN